MRLIDREPLIEYFEGLARSLANARCFNAADAIQGTAEKLRNAPEVVGRHSFDIDANVILDATFGKDPPLFRETDEMCPRCQRDLEVYYCENRTYAVRCKHCKMVTIVSAGSPDEAAEKVGLHVKPVRHGQWIDRGDYITTAYGSLDLKICSNCNAEVTLDGYDYYCPNRRNDDRRIHGTILRTRH